MATATRYSSTKWLPQHEPPVGTQLCYYWMAAVFKSKSSQKQTWPLTTAEKWLLYYGQSKMAAKQLSKWLRMYNDFHTTRPTWPLHAVQLSRWQLRNQTGVSHYRKPSWCRAWPILGQYDPESVSTWPSNGSNWRRIQILVPTTRVSLLRSGSKPNGRLSGTIEGSRLTG